MLAFYLFFTHLFIYPSMSLPPFPSLPFPSLTHSLRFSSTLLIILYLFSTSYFIHSHTCPSFAFLFLPTSYFPQNGKLPIHYAVERNNTYTVCVIAKLAPTCIYTPPLSLSTSGSSDLSPPSSASPRSSSSLPLSPLSTSRSIFDKCVSIMKEYHLEEYDNLDNFWEELAGMEIPEDMETQEEIQACCEEYGRIYLSLSRSHFFSFCLSFSFSLHHALFPSLSLSFSLSLFLFTPHPLSLFYFYLIPPPPPLNPFHSLSLGP